MGLNDSRCLGIAVAVHQLQQDLDPLRDAVQQPVQQYWKAAVQQQSAQYQGISGGPSMAEVCVSYVDWPELTPLEVVLPVQDDPSGASEGALPPNLPDQDPPAGHSGAASFSLVAPNSREPGQSPGAARVGCDVELYRASPCACPSVLLLGEGMVCGRGGVVRQR